MNPFEKPKPGHYQIQWPALSRQEQITDLTLVVPKRAVDGSGSVIVLERIEPGVEPAYCTHGKTTCLWCDEWCWLGDNSHLVVKGGEAAPMCRECATRLLPPDSKPARNVGDHLRADGPHG